MNHIFFHSDFSFVGLSAAILTLKLGCRITNEHLRVYISDNVMSKNKNSALINVQKNESIR